MRRAAGLVLATVAMMGVLVACGDDEGDDGGTAAPDAARTLEEQREDVRKVALQVAPALADSVTGSLTFLRGSWAGCTSADQWTYRDFKYRVAGRIDATGLSVDSLTALTTVLTDEGFEVSVADDSDKQGADGVRDDLATGLNLYPEDGFVLISFAGQCVEVPEDERDAWAQRGEPDKNLVPPAASSPAE